MNNAQDPQTTTNKVMTKLTLPTSAELPPPATRSRLVGAPGRF